MIYRHIQKKFCIFSKKASSLESNIQFIFGLSDDKKSWKIKWRFSLNLGHFGRLPFFSLKLHAFHCLNWQLTLTFNVFPAQKSKQSKQRVQQKFSTALKALAHMPTMFCEVDPIKYRQPWLGCLAMFTFYH